MQTLPSDLLILMPVRCWTCGKVLADKEERLRKYVDAGMGAKEALTELGVVRYCCRSKFITHLPFLFHRDAVSAGAEAEAAYDAAANPKRVKKDTVK